MMPLEHTCPMCVFVLPSLWDMVTQHMEPEKVTNSILEQNNNIWNQHCITDSILTLYAVSAK